MSVVGEAKGGVRLDNSRFTTVIHSPKDDSVIADGCFRQVFGGKAKMWIVCEFTENTLTVIVKPRLLGRFRAYGGVRLVYDNER